MRRKVELIYDIDCPYVGAARERLRRALELAGLPCDWREWDRGNPSSPGYVRQYGSPTILVGGRDVAGTEPSDSSDCCRLYKAEGNAFQGAPPVEMIAAAVRNGGRKTGDGSRFRLRSWWAIFLAVGVAMLPNLACPACWPAYAGLLGSLGLGFFVQTTYLFPITAVVLTLGVATLGYGARSRRGYGPLIVGLAAAAIVVAGKFFFQSDRAMYVGIALLISASAWNSWPKFRAKGSCTACAEVGRRG